MGEGCDQPRAVLRYLAQLPTSIAVHDSSERTEAYRVRCTGKHPGRHGRRRCSRQRSSPWQVQLFSCWQDALILRLVISLSCGCCDCIILQGTKQRQTFTQTRAAAVRPLRTGWA
jgi:hypothetical protein